MDGSHLAVTTHSLIEELNQSDQEFLDESGSRSSIHHTPSYPIGGRVRYNDSYQSASSQERDLGYQELDDSGVLDHSETSNQLVDTSLNNDSNSSEQTFPQRR